MKTFIWILKCISSVVLLFMITGDTFLGKEVLWSDLTIAIWIDVLLLICLHPIVKPFEQPKEERKQTILYILFYGNAIKGFGYSLTDLSRRIYSLTQLRHSVSEESKLSLKALKITMTDTSIESEDIIIY